MADANRTIVANSNSVEQDPAAVAATLARANGEPAPVAPVAVGSEFKTQEELLAAYQALVAKNAEGVTPDPVVAPVAPAVGEEPKVGDLELTPGEPVVEDIADALEAAGLNTEEYTASFLESGTLTEEQFTALGKKGYSKDVVNVYLAGLKNIQTEAKNHTFAAAGGEKDYRAMQQWASQTQPEAEKESFNAALRNPDANQRTLAIQGMYAKYKAAVGTESTLINGGRPAGNVPSDTFQSMLEVRTAMSDKRYGKDSTYTKDVERRVMHTKF